MPKYPISVSVSSSLARKFTPLIARKYANKIENYINTQSQNDPVTVFNYYEIASDLGIDKKVIKDFLFPIGGGSNGITVQNPTVN